ncbi:MAG: CRISPR-associated endonuclease Cas1, partial [Patescibacteria group bacterium]
RVFQQKRELKKIPFANLQQLVLLGNVQLTTPAAITLMKHDVDVVFMSFDGVYQGRLSRNESKFADVRHKQLRLCDDEESSLYIAKAIVEGKIANQRVVLQNRAEQIVNAKQSLESMMKMRQRVQDAIDLNQLRGFEGKAATFYFEGIRTFFSEEWGFHSRQYYPPPDPANALLSFAYTLLLKDTVAQIQLVGLDPYLGFFHTLGYNRPALALDVMEEFRPAIADIAVLSCVTNKHITPTDFEWTNLEHLPVRMTSSAVEVLITAYEERMADKIYHSLANGQTNYRRAMELQVRQMARIIQGEQSDYQPLVMR